MLFALVLYIGLPGLLAALTYMILCLFKSGYFDEVQVTVLDEPLVLSKSITIFYKYCLGSYKDVSIVFNDVADILPAECTRLFGIYYDDDDENKDRKEYKQAAVGCIYEVDGKQLFENNFAVQLTRWGFEQMTLPKVERAVHSRQRFNGYFSKLHLTQHTRQKLKVFMRKNNLYSTLSIEIQDRNNSGEHLDVFKPLDHLEEFFVPEYLSEEQLEIRLQKKKSGSDESETESGSEAESTTSQVEDEGEASDYAAQA